MIEILKKQNIAKILIIINLLLSYSLFGQEYKTFKDVYPKDIKVGAQQTELYFSLIKGKKIGVIANNTSLIDTVHLVDSLKRAGFNVVKVFCPEHGFRGDAEAGEKVTNNIDEKTNIPLISLYGKHFKPTPEDLKGIDIMIFDIQDVGARFYTYISTMSYAMEACAENNITFLVLDRPNPNGHYVDGPILKKEYKSFIGLHPVPIVHGMTIAEYAYMVNGEGWMKNAIKCNLKHVPVKNYSHAMLYQIPIKPSPNLTNMKAIYLYPSLCLFEGTSISVGRGTDKPFEIIGSPYIVGGNIKFTPHSIKGVSVDPPYNNVECFGYDLSDTAISYIKYSQKLFLYYLVEFYKINKDRSNYFNKSFNILSGDSKLKEQIISGMSEDEIRKSWEPDLKKYLEKRKKYLLYTDF